MSDEFLGDRKRALEDAFFRKQEQQARERLRRSEEANEARDALTAASGITDTDVLDALVEGGVSAETVAAMTLFPLIFVAWADHEMESKERAAIIAAAEEEGIAKGSEAWNILSGWLDAQPPESMYDTWNQYTAGLVATMNSATREALKRNVLGRARNIARAAGGFLGIGNKISAAEEVALAKLEEPFEVAG